MVVGEAASGEHQIASKPASRIASSRSRPLCRGVIPLAPRLSPRSALAMRSHSCLAYFGGELNVESTNSTARIPVRSTCSMIALTTMSMSPRW